MKNIFVAVGIVVLGVFIWMQVGGSISGKAPEKPKINRPHVDPNDAANKATSGANKAADTLAGLTSHTWAIIILALMAVSFVVAWNKRPGFKWAVIGIGIATLFFVVFVAPHM